MLYKTYSRKKQVLENFCNQFCECDKWFRTFACSINIILSLLFEDVTSVKINEMCEMRLNILCKDEEVTTQKYN